MNIPTILMTVSVLCCSSIVSYGDEPTLRSAASDDPLVVKLYDIGVLTNSAVAFPFDPAIPATEAKTSTHTMPLTQQGSIGGGQGGGGFGGGGLGGGGLGGRGMYSIPSNAQFVPANGNSASQGVHNASRLLEILQAIQSVVAPESWEQMGGKGTIATVNQTLIVRQTASAHQDIRDLLDALKSQLLAETSLTVELWWLPVEPEFRAKLNACVKGEDAHAKVDELCAATSGHHGIVRTRSGFTANVVTGYRMPLVVSRIPVVGSGAQGIQPVVKTVNVGLMAEVQVTSSDKPHGKTAVVNLRTALTDLQHFEDSESTGGDIDRFQLQNHILEAGFDCSVNRPVIAGSLSAPASSEEHATEVVVIACIRDDRG